MSRREGLVHDALFYDSEDDLLAGAVPFLRDGLVAGETVVIACAEPNQAALVAAVDNDPGLTVVPRQEVYGRPAGALPAWERRLARPLSAGGLVRLAVDVGFAPDPAGWAAWARSEAVGDRLLGPYPIWALCLYDTRTVPADALHAATLTHPNLRHGGRRAGNPAYVPPEEFLRRHSPVRPDPLTATRPALVLDHLGNPADLRRVRRELRSALAGSGLSADSAENFVVAANELAGNAVQHGAPPAALRLWTAPGRVLCTVTDSGPGITDPFAGYRPGTARAGMGLWFCRQICSTVEAFHSPAGFTVQISLDLAGPDRSSRT